MLWLHSPLNNYIWSLLDHHLSVSLYKTSHINAEFSYSYYCCCEWSGFTFLMFVYWKLKPHPRFPPSASYLSGQWGPGSRLRPLSPFHPGDAPLSCCWTGIPPVGCAALCCVLDPPCIPKTISWQFSLIIHFPLEARVWEWGSYSGLGSMSWVEPLYV